MAFTKEQLLDYLVMGYTHQQFNIKSQDINYPQELNQIIITFIENIFLSFDMTHDNYRHCLQNYGTLIKSTLCKTFNICSSYAFEPGSINSFKVRCLDGQGTMAEIVGIASNTEEFVQEVYVWCKQSNANVYYYCGTGGISEGYNNKKLGVDTYGGLRQIVEIWKKGDTITINVDCIDWRFTVYHNDKQLGVAMSMVENITYYPFMSIKSNCEFELVY